MKIYFAAIEQKAHLKKFKEAGAKRGLAVGWEYFDKDFSEILNSVEDLFLDSGGFSAFTRNLKIDIDQYIAFIKKYKIKTYAVLDEIGDPKKTAENQKYMESKGLDPIPVFHYKSPLEDLKKMVEEYDYIALGGLVPLARRKKQLKTWLSSCFSIIRDKSRVHGFGMTGMDILSSFPFYSVDSTSWLSGEIQGNFYRFENGNLKSYSIKDKEDCFNGDISFKKFMDGKEKRNYRNRSVHSIKIFMEVEKYLTRLWEKRGIKFNS